MERSDTGKIPIFEKLSSFSLHGSEISSIGKLKPNTDEIIKSFDFSCPSQTGMLTYRKSYCSAVSCQVFVGKDQQQ